LDSPTLFFPDPVVSRDFPPEANVQAGHHDFWFENRSPFPIELSLKDKSCACAEAAMCITDAEKAKRYRLWATEATISALTSPIRGMLAFSTQLQLDGNFTAGWRDAELVWKPLPPGIQKTQLIDSGYSGMIRVTWKEPKENQRPKRFGRELRLVLVLSVLAVQPTAVPSYRQLELMIGHGGPTFPGSPRFDFGRNADK
jgi:hypothetical protein